MPMSPCSRSCLPANSHSEGGTEAAVTLQRRPSIQPPGTRIPINRPTQRALSAQPIAARQRTQSPRPKHQTLLKTNERQKTTHRHPRRLYCRQINYPCHQSVRPQCCSPLILQPWQLAFQCQISRCHRQERVMCWHGATTSFHLSAHLEGEV
jgi:hypothetical protein